MVLEGNVTEIVPKLRQVSRYKTSLCFFDILSSYFHNQMS